MFEAEVAKGAGWLDANHPGWERRIDLAVLDLSSPCRCVLGQIGGDFWDFLASVPMGVGRIPWAVRHGFAMDISGSLYEPPDWAALDETWISLIKERFDSGLLSDG